MQSREIASAESPARSVWISLATFPVIWQRWLSASQWVTLLGIELMLWDKCVLELIWESGIRFCVGHSCVCIGDRMFRLCLCWWPFAKEKHSVGHKRVMLRQELTSKGTSTGITEPKWWSAFCRISTAFSIGQFISLYFAKYRAALTTQ